MIALLTSEFDESARSAVEGGWLRGEAAILTVADLTSRGWVVPTQRIAESSFVAGGVAYPIDALSGVLNLLPQVYDFEVLRVRQPDRHYVSSELFAFLVWWLGALPCPVANRPTPACLNGPSWGREQWEDACVRAGVPVAGAVRDSAALGEDLSQGGRTATTTIVGSLAAGELYLPESRTLAKLARTSYLEVCFCEHGTGWAFHGVNLLPRIGRADIRGMLEEWLRGGTNETSVGTGMGSGRRCSD